MQCEGGCVIRPILNVRTYGSRSSINALLFRVFGFVNWPLGHLPPRFHVALISIIFCIYLLLAPDYLYFILWFSFVNNCRRWEMEEECCEGQRGTRALRWWVVKAIRWCRGRRSNLPPNSVYLGRVFHVFFTVHGDGKFLSFGVGCVCGSCWWGLVRYGNS